MCILLFFIIRSIVLDLSEIWNNLNSSRPLGVFLNWESWNRTTLWTWSGSCQRREVRLSSVNKICCISKRLGCGFFYAHPFLNPAQTWSMILVVSNWFNGYCGLNLVPFLERFSWNSRLMAKTGKFWKARILKIWLESWIFRHLILPWPLTNKSFQSPNTLQPRSRKTRRLKSFMLWAVEFNLKFL